MGPFGTAKSFFGSAESNFDKFSNLFTNNYIYPQKTRITIYLQFQHKFGLQLYSYIQSFFQKLIRINGAPQELNLNILVSWGYSEKQTEISLKYKYKNS